MAYETGTATDAQDLYDKLIAFLTTNADLVAADQEWSVVWDTPAVYENQSDVVLRGPGLEGGDNVYVGLRLVINVPAGIYDIKLQGMTGVIPSANSYSEHVNSAPRAVKICIDDTNMTYWFVANGRHFKVLVKVSTVYESAYAGFFLPYATPLQYPYPYFIGGSAPDSSQVVDWRSTSVAHSGYLLGFQEEGEEEATGFVIDPAGAWTKCSATMPVAVVGRYESAIWPNPIDFGPLSYEDLDDEPSSFYIERLADAFGGDRQLTRPHIYRRNPSASMFGVFDGVYRCQGIGNSAENIITVDGVDHLVFPDTYRSSLSSYSAMALEA